MRLYSILAAYVQCSNNFAFHLGMFIGLWFFTPEISEYHEDPAIFAALTEEE